MKTKRLSAVKTTPHISQRSENHASHKSRQTKLFNAAAVRLSEHEQLATHFSGHKQQATHFSGHKQQATHFSGHEQLATHFSGHKQLATHFSGHEQLATHFSGHEQLRLTINVTFVHSSYGVWQQDVNHSFAYQTF